MYGRWRVQYDPEATRRAYAEIEQGGVDNCECLYCRNFASAREQLFSPSMLELFDMLGIDYRKDAEVWEASKKGARVRFYSGWFHFIGHVEYVGDPLPPVQLHATMMSTKSDHVAMTPHFAISFEPSGELAQEPFLSGPIGTLSFCADVPWVLDEPPTG